jgi:hypothetical protein
VDDLALQVAEVDDIEVDETDGPDPGGGEIEGGRAAEATRADKQRLAREQLRLTGRADLRDEQVATVALLLLATQDDRAIEFEAGALPALEALGHGRHVGVAHLLQGLGGEQRADTAGAVQDHRLVAVGGDTLDVLLDVGLRHVLGARDVALLPLGRLADVDDRGGSAVERGDLLGADFADLRAGFAQEIGVGLRHGVRGTPVGRQAGLGFRGQGGEGGPTVLL